MRQLTLTRFENLDYACNEALNTLCANISFSGVDVKVIMLTSCHAQEGKSFLAMNIMRNFAQIGKKVVLVDGDLRRPMLSSRYGIEGGAGQPGLAHYLAGISTHEDVLCSTNLSGADMILAGREVANSLALLSTDKLPTMIARLRENYDIVLIDAPPVGVIIDPAQIAKSCDGVLLVVSKDGATRRELVEAKRQIEMSGCPILGAVLNKVVYETGWKRLYYYRHYNRSYYSNYYTASGKSETHPRFGSSKSRAGAQKRRKKKPAERRRAQE